MIYTHAVWTVREGCEGDFVELWRELGEWTTSVYRDAHGTLLRDCERPGRFVSFGPWRTREEVESWRGAPEFQSVLERMRELLDGFEPGTFDVVLELRAPG